MEKDIRQINKSKNEIWLLIVAYMVLLTVIITVACSCSPQRKLANLEQKHPELLMQFCASKAVTDTQIIDKPGYWITPDNDRRKIQNGYYLTGDTLKFYDCVILLPAGGYMWPKNIVFTQDTFGHPLNSPDSNIILAPDSIWRTYPIYQWQNVTYNPELLTFNPNGSSKGVIRNKKASKPIYVPPTKTIIVHTVDTSGKALLRSENSRLTDENNTLQGKISTWQFWAILGYVIAIALAVVIGFLIKWK